MWVYSEWDRRDECNDEEAGVVNELMVSDSEIAFHGSLYTKDLSPCIYSFDITWPKVHHSKESAKKCAGGVATLVYLTLKSAHVAKAVAGTQADGLIKGFCSRFSFILEINQRGREVKIER